LKLALELPVRPLHSYDPGKLFIRTVSDAFIDAQKLMELSASGEVRP